MDTGLLRCETLWPPILEVCFQNTPTLIWVLSRISMSKTLGVNQLPKTSPTEVTFFGEIRVRVRILSSLRQVHLIWLPMEMGFVPTHGVNSSSIRFLMDFGSLVRSVSDRCQVLTLLWSESLYSRPHSKPRPCHLCTSESAMRLLDYF